MKPMQWGTALIALAAADHAHATNSVFVGLQGINESDLSGSSVSASRDVVYPYPFQDIHGIASATATKGILNSFSYARSTPTNTPGAGPPTQDFDARADASTDFRFTVQAPGLSNPGIVTLVWETQLDGRLEAWASDPGAHGSIQARYSSYVDLWAPDLGFGDFVQSNLSAQSGLFGGGTNQSIVIDETLRAIVTVDLSSPVDIRANLYLDTNIEATDIDPETEWYGVADFSDSLIWGGLVSATLANGDDVTDYITAPGLGGFDWTNPVPAPSSIGLLVLGPVVVARRRIS